MAGFKRWKWSGHLNTCEFIVRKKSTGKPYSLSRIMESYAAEYGLPVGSMIVVGEDRRASYARSVELAQSEDRRRHLKTASLACQATERN